MMKLFKFFSHNDDSNYNAEMSTENISPDSSDSQESVPNNNNSEAGEVNSGEESAKQQNYVGTNFKMIIGALGIFLFLSGGYVIYSRTSSTQTNEFDAKNVSFPSLGANPTEGIPDNYADVPKSNILKDKDKEKAPEVPVQPVIVQEVPRISDEDRQAEEREKKHLQQIYSSSISFNMDNKNVASSNESSAVIAKYKTQPHSRLSGYTLSTGSIIPVTMLTGATSDMPNSDIIAQVRQNVYDSRTGKKILIPQGARLLGKSGAAGHRANKRLGLSFSRLVFPNGKSVDLPNQNAIDGTGIPGVKDKYTQHSSKLMRTAFLSAIFSAAAQSATRGTGGTNNYRSAGDEAISGAAANILETANTIVKRDANLDPTIEIRPGLQFNVFVSRDFALKEYQFE